MLSDIFTLKSFFHQDLFMIMLVERDDKVAIKFLLGYEGRSNKNQVPTETLKFEQHGISTFISKGVCSHARVQGSELIQTSGLL